MGIVMTAILPHPPILMHEIGKGEEERIAATQRAYIEIAGRVAATRVDTVVIVSPHATAYADYFHISPGKNARGDFRRYGLPELEVEARYDEAFVRALADEAKRAGVPAGIKGERDARLDHGTMIPLVYLAEAGVRCEIVRIGLSGLGADLHYRLGKCIKKAAETLGRDTVVLASGDLSHKLLENGPYGFAHEGPLFDEAATLAMAEGDFFSLMTFDPAICDAAAQCGLGAFRVMAGALDQTRVKSRLLSYEGPYGIGYAVASFYPDGADETRAFDLAYLRMERERLEANRKSEDAYVRLARDAVDSFVRTGKKPMLPEDLPDALKKDRAGAFVTLKLHGSLRGCIGSVKPTAASLAEEIQKSAISACSADERFEPVTERELDELTYSVDVIGQTERIESIERLDVKKYGVIVTSGYRRGLLLPNLEGVNDVKTQLSIAKKKAGIPESERCRMERFEVERHA